MHSRIYQISWQPISKENFLEEEQVAEFTSGIDYADEFSEDYRYEQIQLLAEHILPPGLFVADSSDKSIVYQGGLDEWLKNYIQSIKDLANELTPEDILNFSGKKWDLQQLLKRPFGGHVMFAIDDNPCAEFSTEFLEFIKDIEVGQKVYIGAVFDYHW